MSCEQKSLELVYSRDGEFFNFDDLRDVIDVYDLGVGDVVHVGEKSPKPASAYIDIDCIIDQMGERAMDEVGDPASDFPDVSSAARDELRQMLSEWANKHCDVSFYPVINSREHTITKADVDAAN